MKRALPIPAVLIALPLSILSCGGDEPAPEPEATSPTREEIVARFEALVAIVRQGERDISGSLVVDSARAGEFIVYHGPDASRDWRDLATGGTEEDARRIADLCEQVAYHTRLDDPVYGEVRIQRGWGAASAEVYTVFREAEGSGKILVFMKVTGKIALAALE